MNRIVDVARIQFVNRRAALGLPLGVLALALLFSMAIFVMLGNVLDTDVDGQVSTGGLSAIFAVIGVSQIQAITQYFPFALGLSVTRRHFYAATSLFALVQAVGFGLVMTIGLVVERATGGWGLRMGFFQYTLPADADLGTAWLVYTAILLAVSAVGMAFGVVAKRWGYLGVYAVLTALAVLVVGAAAVVGWQEWWPQVLSVFTDPPAPIVVVGGLLVTAAVVGGAGWLALRRATP